MKKVYLFFVFLFSSIILLNGQIGINTQYPYSKTVLHIDSKGDNGNSTTPTNTIDDIVIDKNGNIGIGVLDPQYRLDINSGGTAASPIPAIHIKDGGELQGRVLTSDANGVATWGPFGTIPSAVATFKGNTGYNPSVDLPSTYMSTGTTLTLKPGIWMVFVSILINPNPVSSTAGTKYWLRTTFADGDIAMGTQIATASSDFIGSNTLVAGLIDGTSQFSMISGFVKIKNTTNQPKTYTYIAGKSMWGIAGVYLKHLAQGIWLEDNITAILLDN